MTFIIITYHLMIPYLMTIVVLVGMSRRATVPASLLKPYRREENRALCIPVRFNDDQFPYCPVFLNFISQRLAKCFTYSHINSITDMECLK